MGKGLQASPSNESLADRGNRRAFSTLRNKGPHLSVKDTLGEAAYGRGREYKAPNNDWIYKGLNNAPLGKANKQKFVTFAENIMAKKKWVPGPGTN